MKEQREETKESRQVSSALAPRVRGGQPLAGGPQIDVERIMQGFDETLAANPKPWRDDSETYTALVRYSPGDEAVSQLMPPDSLLEPIEKTRLEKKTNGATVTQQNMLDSFSNKPAPTPANASPQKNANVSPSKPNVQTPYDERENSGALQMVAVDLFKSYKKGKLAVPVLKGVNLGVREGEMLAIVGQSGSGKSTLLHLLGTLDSPDSGSIHFDGQRIDSISNSQRDLLRNRFIGMIFQFYHLIPEMTTLENVLSPIMIRESVWGYMTRRKKHRQKAIELLERVGLGHRLRHKPSELSGGEMQRAAIARALISDPQILLADEPTGNLDLNSAKEVLQLLRDLNREKKVTIVMVTHDLSIAQEADRTIRLVDGRVVR